MDKVDIKDISNNLILSPIINKGSKRKFFLMKEDYITLKFSTDNPVYFKLGDYANIPGDPTGLFELIDLYQPTYNDSTGGYDYELRLDAYYRKWKNKKFFLTPQTGGREASWNCTGTLDVHLSIFLRNLNALGYAYRGQAFEYDIDTSVVEQTAKFIQYDNINLLDALTRMAEAWECEWWIAGNKICFGRCESGDPVDFELNVNVDSMTRSDSRTNYATRIYAFGSTRNIPPYYRKSLIFEVGEVSNEYIVDTKRPLKDFFLGKGFGLSKIDISPSKLVCPLDAQERTKVFSKTLQIGKALGKIGYTFDASAFDIVLSSSISVMSLEIWGVVTIAGKETTYGNEITLSPNDKQTIHLSNFPVQLNSDTEDLQVLVEIYFKNTGKSASSCMADFSGSLSFNADKAIYPTKVNFSSGVNKGKSLDAYAIYDSGLKERRLRIDTTGVLVGDTFTLSSVCYNKVPLSYFTSDLDDLVVNGIVQKRLMLPAGINCIEAFPDMKQEEAVEDIVVFEDVFPRRTAGISEVNHTTEPEHNENGNETGQTIYTYTFIDEGLKNFSNDYLLSEQELRANFQTGSLGGMSFELILKDTGDWGTKFEIERNEDYGLILPNEWLKPTNGDTYILSGFDAQLVSDLMIPAAERELKQKAIKYAEKPKIDPSTYDCTLYSEYAFGIDPQSGKQDDRFAKRFNIGQRVNLLNRAYFKNGRISRIIGFELNLDIPYDSPVYTVGETAPYSRVGELEEKVDALTYKGQAFTPTANNGNGVYIIGRYDKTSPTDRNVYSSLRTDKEIDERSLSKLHDDKTDFHINFNNGITAGLKDNPVTLNGVLSSAITEEGEPLAEVLNTHIIEDGEPLEGELPTGFPYLTGVTGPGNGEVIFHLQGADGIVWNAAHSHAWSQITGRPTKLSDFKNDLTFEQVDLSSYYTKEDCNKEFATKDELSGYLKNQKFRGIGYRPTSSLAQTSLLSDTDSIPLVLVGGNNVSLNRVAGTTNELKIDVWVPSVDLSGYATIKQLSGYVPLTGNVTVKGNTRFEQGCYNIALSTANAKYMRLCVLTVNGTYVNTPLTFSLSGRSTSSIDHISLKLTNAASSAAHKVQAFSYIGGGEYGSKLKVYKLEETGTVFEIWLEQTQSYDSFRVLNVNVPGGMSLVWSGMGSASLPTFYYSQTSCQLAKVTGVVDWEDILNQPVGSDLTLGRLDPICQNNYIPSSNDTLSHAICQTHCLANAAYLTAGGAVKRSGDTMTNHLYLSIGENYTHKACVGACDSGVNYAFLQAMTKEGVNKGFIKVGPGLMYNDGVSTYNVLHSGNFNSYALSLNGGVVRGSTRFDMGTYNMVFSTNNSRYMRLCVLTVTNAYVNTPLTFSIHGRSTVSSKDRIVLKLTNAATAAAHQVESFNYVGDGNYGSKLKVYKIEETGTVFEIWLEQTQSYDSFRILDLCIPGNMNLVWSGMTSSSLPSSYYSVNDCSNDNNYVPLCGGVTMTGPLELLGSGINADNFGVSAPSFMANASRLGSSSYGIFTGSTWIGIGAKNANTLLIGRSAWNGPINASAQIGLEVTGYATAAGFKVTGKAGFLKANGTIDNNTYLTQHQSLADYVKTSDSRLSDAREAKDVHDWAKATTKPDYIGTEITLGKLDSICQNNYVPSSSDTLSHAICQTHCLANAALSIANEAVKDILVSGSGNAVTGATLSNNKITLTKGATFLTQHAYRGIGYRPSSGLAQLSLIGSSDSIPLVLVGGNNVTLSKISGTTNELRIDVDLSAYYTASKADTTFATKDELGDYLTFITGSMVTKALGYTPANANQLSNYVPLTGEVTMTGTLQIQGENIDADMFGVSAPSFMANASRLGSSSYGIFTGSTWIGIGAKDSSTLVIGRSAWNGTISTSTAIGLQVPGHVTASGFKVGTSTGFLKANGSVDNNTYLTAHQSLSNYVSLSGTQTISGTKSFSIVQRMNNNVPLHFGTSASYKGQIGYDYTNDIFIISSTKSKILLAVNSLSKDSFAGAYTSIGGGMVEVTAAGMHVAGNITAAGTISDRRLKTNLQIVKNAGSLIRSLGGVYTFNYTDEAHRLNEYLPNEDYGLIYQNVNRVLPEFTSQLNNGYGCVKYEKFIPLLLASQIEQLSEVDRLKREVQRLKFELDVLKDKININN